ncbi:MAG: hypothetical protein KatS3mg110_3790 [Pirellulaceae bacterium]|nr:MAG: hypothetical protein KatS3mg110_3777 [Pirellulaceae bacterium]GIW95749.1 MAG: hypothetical protein KatS3mg110_3790 [Pirellulaceae bacterium]
MIFTWPHFKQWLGPLLLVFLADTAVSSVIWGNPPNDTDPLIGALAAAITQWHRDLQFYCTYQLFEGSARSVQDALAEKYIRPPELVARGLYVKTRDYIRQQIDYIKEDPGRVPVGATESEQGVMDWEAVRSLKTGVALFYYPSLGDALFGETMAIQRPFPVDSPSASYFPVYSPCVLFGESSRPNYLLFLREQQQSAKDVTFEVMRHDGESILVGARYAAPGLAGPMRFSFDFLNTRPYPILREARIEAMSDGREKVLVSQFSDFVEVIGGLLARKVVIVLAGGKAPTASVTLWQSTDLGSRPPRHEDCLVRIAQGHVIRCLRETSYPPLVGGYKTIDITKLSPNDIAEACRKPQSRTRSFTRMAVWGFFGVTVLSLACWGLYRWRQRHKNG